MKNPILVKRYTQGLAAALKDETEYATVIRELAEFRDLASGHGALKATLENPFVDARKKVQIIEEVLAGSGFADKTSRFILLLLDHKRLAFLGDVLEGLPVVWNERRGVATFEVSSVVALAETQKVRLRAELERLEGRPVHLRYSIDPGLVAGFSLRKGNIIYDASLRGHLERIKQKISEG
jgi:F-type H+-transporting ATPase subunit delta